MDSRFFNTIGDCADDLLGGGNAVSIVDAANALEILDELSFVVKLYIKQCVSDCKIADHNADHELLRRVRGEAYDFGTKD
jgi:hypothetical protein